MTENRAEGRGGWTTQRRSERARREGGLKKQALKRRRILPESETCLSFPPSSFCSSCLRVGNFSRGGGVTVTQVRNIPTRAHTRCVCVLAHRPCVCLFCRMTEAQFLNVYENEVSSTSSHFYTLMMEH